MSNENLVYIDLDVNTPRGKKYQGTFTLKKYLNQRERNEVARIANKLSVGLRRPSSYSLTVIYDLATSAIRNSLSRIMLDSKVVDKYEDTLKPENIAAQVLDAILPEIKDIDPRAEEMYYLAMLNVHIVDAPEWWKPKGESEGGLLIEDYEPIAQLYIQLMEAQKPPVPETTKDSLEPKE